MQLKCLMFIMALRYGTPEAEGLLHGYDLNLCKVMRENESGLLNG